MVAKEECVGHVQKRMGTALDEYKKMMRGMKLSYGEGEGGAGRLTQDMIKRIQNYYGFVIREEPRWNGDCHHGNKASYHSSS